MPRPVILETFAQPGGPEPFADPDAVVMAEEALEEARLASYEEGFKAGWDDAVAAAEAEGESLRREAMRNLQALSFTFHEARSHLLDGLATLIEAICDRLLPEIARSAVGGHVRDAVLPLAGAAMDRPVTVLLNPATRSVVEEALAGGTAPPLDIVEDPDLGEAEVHLRSGGEERRIDLDAAVAEIRAAVAAFFAAMPQDASAAGAPSEPEEALKHG
ncbi:MAG: flagellar biosynthesis protein [Alkalilacustris sp.]